jgi:hypothetical protein
VDNRLTLCYTAENSIIAAMGSVRDTFKGKTQAEVFEKLQREKKIMEGSGLELMYPLGTKTEIYAQMKQDPATGEWSVNFLFDN